MQILVEHGFKIEEVRYLENPPTKKELTKLCELMKAEPSEIIRTGEALFSELGLTKQDKRSDDEWLTILVENPKLIERPIVKIGNKAILGRPPESVLEII